METLCSKEKEAYDEFSLQAHLQQKTEGSLETAQIPTCKIETSDKLWKEGGISRK